jgi:hypothetical protein
MAGADEPGSTAGDSASGLTGTDSATAAGADTTMDTESVAELPSFDDVDADGDGRITREEAASVSELDQQFDQLDANSDEELSNDEYEAATQS